ncbi:plasmid maintenance system antidote protein [Flavobacterium sp. Sd200]|uniref:helix-turn-helix transcriptional regulator n=1 Tax=Flavobacterium sp. Sd200 TaxID=2692211 RepID=UPI001369FC46|nr:plasmid maintenance system antidote protein [Flavobacterium sp. Sd200]MXN93092.1 plasmid maintenance system antidote protein [Flavobacterium sp. Sd200]
MDKQFERYRGIHPGAILQRELAKRQLAQRPFALSIGEFPQSLNQIILGKRDLSTATALKLERALDLKEGTLVLLQAYYDIAKLKKKEAAHNTPDLSRLRKSLFWDTNIAKVDWQLQAPAVIMRIFERGNLTEKKEIMRFYGKEKVRKTIATLHD